MKSGSNKAFISYGREGNEALAPALHKGLERFGKRWFLRRAFPVFLDHEHLGAVPNLKAHILEELDRSDFFVLMASPDAVRRPWVREEIRHWFTKPNAADRFLVALTGGDIVWSPGASDFDWTKTTALPHDLLAGKLRDQPLYADLRWARDQTELSLQEPRFREAVRGLAAALHGRKPYELDREDLKEQLRARRFRVGVWLLLGLVLLVSCYAYREQQLGLARALSSNAEVELVSDPALSLHIATRSAEIARRMRGPPPDVLRSALVESSLTTVRTEPTHPFSKCAISMDGQWLAAVTEAGLLRVWRVDPANPWDALSARPAWSVNHDRATSLEFSPFAPVLVMATSSGRVCVWDRTNGRELAIFTNASGRAVVAVAFRSDSETLASCDDAGWLRLCSWGQPTNGWLAATNIGAQAYGVAFSGDGALVACGTRDKRALIGSWDGQNLSPRFSLLHPNSVDAVTFHPTRPVLLTACRDGIARLWNATNGECIGDFASHGQGQKMQAMFVGNGQRVLTRGFDGTARVQPAWQGGNREAIPLKYIDALTWAGPSPSGEHVVTLSRTAVQIWSAADGQLLRVLKGHRQLINSAVINPHANLAVTASGESSGPLADADNSLRAWRLRLPQLLTNVPPPANGLLYGSFSQQTGRLIIGRMTNANVLNLTTGSLLPSNPIERAASAPIYQVELPANGRFAAVLYGDREIVTYDLANGMALRTQSIHSVKVNALRTISDGTWSASCDHSGAVYIWQTAVQDLPGLIRHSAAVSTLALRRQGDLLFTACEDGTNRVWRLKASPRVGWPGRTSLAWRRDTTNGVWQLVDPRPITEMPRTARVIAAEFSPSEPALALACEDGIVRVWNYARNRIERPMRGHAGRIRSVRYSEDGGLIVTAGQDGTARVWTANTGYNFAVFTAASQELIGAAFDPSGRKIITLSGKGALRVYDCEECCSDEELLNLARTRSQSRPLTELERRAHLWE